MFLPSLIQFTFQFKETLEIRTRPVTTGLVKRSKPDYFCNLFQNFIETLDAKINEDAVHLYNLLIMEDDYDDKDHADNSTGDTEIFGYSRHSSKWS